MWKHKLLSFASHQHYFSPCFISSYANGYTRATTSHFFLPQMTLPGQTTMLGCEPRIPLDFQKHRRWREEWATWVTSTCLISEQQLVMNSIDLLSGIRLCCFRFGFPKPEWIRLSLWNAHYFFTCCITAYALEAWTRCDCFRLIWSFILDWWHFFNLLHYFPLC